MNSAITLENELIRVSILPEKGGNIREIFYKSAGRNVLFEHPWVKPRPAPYGANFEAYWTGGIDECAPTGNPCSFDGESLPVLGEFWSQAWDVDDVSDDCVSISCNGVVFPLRIERRMELRSGAPGLRSHHCVKNVGSKAVPLFWGLHVGMPVAPGLEISIPAEEALSADMPAVGVIEPVGTSTNWPPKRVQELTDNPSDDWWMYIARRLSDGWCAVRDPSWGGGLGIVFDRSVFKCVWLWVSDGGWRGVRCLAIEPWTGYPLALDEALAAGAVPFLAPGETCTTELQFVPFQSEAPISGFSADGTPDYAATLDRERRLR